MIFEGMKITVSDLRMTVYSGSSPTIPDSITYVIQQGTTTYLSGSGTYDGGSGAYYPDVTLPVGLTGSVDIVWTIVIASVGTSTAQQTFTVYTRDLISLSTDIFSGKAKEYITLLRYGLRDWNPDLFYRFNPVLDPERNYTDNYKQEVIWSDQELYYYLYLALSDINSKPPLTSYTFDSIPAQYLSAFFSSAKYQACYAKALNWAAEDFVFNVGNNSVNIERQEKYTRMAEIYWQQYQALVEQAKKATEKFVCLRGKYL